MSHSKSNPLGPERSVPGKSGTHTTAASARPTSAIDLTPVRAGQLSRLDSEIEALRRSPTPTQSSSLVTPDQDGQRKTNPFLDGVAFMGIFSRTRDIIAANFNDLLDQADDPSKMIRMIILEMEETLVEVRAGAARTIADQKEMHRHAVKLSKLEADWGDKAQLALSKDREDLARAALVEKKKAANMGDQLFRHHGKDFAIGVSDFAGIGTNSYISQQGK